MLILTARVGEVIQMGNVAAIKVLDKSGRRVKLAFATQMSPITLIATGIIPRQFTTGVTGEPRTIEPMRATG